MREEFKKALEHFGIALSSGRYWVGKFRVKMKSSLLKQVEIRVLYSVRFYIELRAQVKFTRYLKLKNALAALSKVIQDLNKLVDTLVGKPGYRAYLHIEKFKPKFKPMERNIENWWEDHFDEIKTSFAPLEGIGIGIQPKFPAEFLIPSIYRDVVLLIKVNDVFHCAFGPYFRYDNPDDFLIQLIPLWHEFADLAEQMSKCEKNLYALRKRFQKKASVNTIKKVLDEIENKVGRKLDHIRDTLTRLVNYKALCLDYYADLEKKMTQGTKGTISEDSFRLTRWWVGPAERRYNVIAQRFTDTKRYLLEKMEILNITASLSLTKQMVKHESWVKWLTIGIFTLTLILVIREFLLYFKLI